MIDNLQLRAIPQIDPQRIDLSAQDEAYLKTGAVLRRGNGSAIKLGEVISEGGQGIIYRTNAPNCVAKIYKNDDQVAYRTKLMEAKIKHMVANSTQNARICWPVDTLYLGKNFVGFIMPEVSGKNLYSLTTNKNRVMRNYPGYDKFCQIDMILNILQQMQFLHERNILVGDIKLENIIFTESFDVVLIDMDSVQIDEYACTTSTEGYDAPEVIAHYGAENVIQKTADGVYAFNRYYNEFYRTKEQEYHALAVLLFRLLMNGKPYSCEDMDFYVEDNREFDDKDYELGFCVEGKFAYGLNARDTNPSCKERAIWSHLPSFIKEAFVKTFTGIGRISPKEWIQLFEHYRNLLQSRSIVETGVFPTNEIDYSKVLFPLAKNGKGFLMEHAVIRVARALNDKNIKDLGVIAEVVKALKREPVCEYGGYRFSLVYNIGVLKKVEAVLNT